MVWPSRKKGGCGEPETMTKRKLESFIIFEIVVNVSAHSVRSPKLEGLMEIMSLNGLCLISAFLMGN